MDYNVVLNFTDGLTQIIDCGAQETVLDAAYRHQINLPMDCSDGVCGTCRCQCENGQYDQGEDYLDDALSEEDAANGHVLTCQMIPQSDCVLSVPVASHICKLKPSVHVANICGIDKISDTTFILKLETRANEPFDFLPGQYVNLNVPGTTQSRSYSMSNKPRQKDLSFLIKNIPGGIMSDWLSGQARLGMEITFAGPNGIFFLRETKRPIVFLAGGTGLAPILSMLDVLAQMGCSQNIQLFYGVNNLPDLSELERLNTLTKVLPDFTYETIVVDVVSGHNKTGYVTDHIRAEHLNGGDTDIYLCGPPPMVDAVRVFLEKINITPANLYFEKFAPSQREDS